MSSIVLKQDIDVTLTQNVGGDSMVVAAAKVSTTGEQAKSFVDADANFGLINYLMAHRHGTPFEHNMMTFFVYAPIFVWREWHRHRIGFSYNEESGRYKQLDPVFYVPAPTRPMLKVEKWKAGRPKFLRTSDDSFNEYEMEENYQKYDTLCRNLIRSYALAYEMYEDNLKLGVDPGLARDCLPVGIYSGCWVTCNARSLMAFLSLRTHDATAAKVSYPLYEIEMAARKCEAIFSDLYPLTYKAFVENGRQGP